MISKKLNVGWCSKLIWSVLFMLMSAIGFAEPYTPPLLPAPENEQFYYEIGGGTAFRIRAGIEVPVANRLHDEFMLTIGNGDFDPIKSVKKTLKGIMDGILDAFENKAKELLDLDDMLATLLGFFPGVVACQANPTSCQLSENYTIRSETRERFNRQFYEKMEAELGKARGKLDGWFNAGKANNLIKVMNEAKNDSNKDLEEVVQKIRDYSGSDGLKWIGGIMAGGDNQPPIRPTADTVKAGFNMLLGRTVTNSGRASGDDPLLQFWDTPEEAAKWTVDVVGEFRPDINNKVQQTSVGGLSQGNDDGDLGKGGEDVVVNNSFLSNDRSTPALGLTPKVRKEARLVESKLTTLVNSSTPPTTDELTQMLGQSGSTVITPTIINILKNSPLDKVLIRQISDDIAVSNVIHYAMAARRMLLAGRNEPHIASYDVGLKDINDRAGRLKENIEDLMFERRIKKELLSETLSMIYKQNKTKRNEGSFATPSIINQPASDGAIHLNGDPD